MTSRPATVPKIIETRRLELRPFSPSDAPAVFAYSRDPEWIRYQQTTPASEAEAERVVAELLRRSWEDQPAWAITRSDDTANTDARNRSSIRLLTKLGFVHEGTLRSGAVSAAGELVDGAFYGLLRSEW